VCCSVLQCVAVCCSVLQCVAVFYFVCWHYDAHDRWLRLQNHGMAGVCVLQCIAVCCSELLCVAVCCNAVLRALSTKLSRYVRVTTCCRVLQGVAGCCRVLQGVAGCCRVVLFSLHTILLLCMCCSVLRMLQHVAACCSVVICCFLYETLSLCAHACARACACECVCTRALYHSIRDRVHACTRDQR